MLLMMVFPLKVSTIQHAVLVLLPLPFSFQCQYTNLWWVTLTVRSDSSVDLVLNIHFQNLECLMSNFRLVQFSNVGIFMSTSGVHFSKMPESRVAKSPSQPLLTPAHKSTHWASSQQQTNGMQDTCQHIQWYFSWAVSSTLLPCSSSL